MLNDLANIWIGCGCLFALGAVLLLLVIGLGQGGTPGLLALLGLVGIGAYLIWAYRTR
jgi:hypothetical protein